jgi:predicted nucleic acid-binding Zn ribbon protein
VSDTPQGSGADLARQALAAARANAKNTPAPKDRKPRTRIQRGERGPGRDPIAFGNLLGKVSTEQGWPAALDGGSVLNRWAELCPQFAETVQPAGYDPERRVLDLRPSTHAVASGLRLLGGQLAKQINDKLGSTVVRAIRVLPVGRFTTTTDGPVVTDTVDLDSPVRTRDDGCPGYQDNRAILLERRPSPPPVDPYIQEVMARQEAALRANRQPEAEHRDAVWAETDTPAGPAPGSVEESLARARAYARKNRESRAPRRAFDVA